MNDIKCPQCGGNRVEWTGNICKCMYCGANFQPVTKQEEYIQEQSQKGQTAYAVPNGATQNIINVNVAPQPHVYTPPMASTSNYQYRDRKSKSTAAVLAFFLGGFGAHKFYLRQTGLGVLYLIFFWTWIPSIIAFIEFIILLCTSEEEFDRKYNM